MNYEVSEKWGRRGPRQDEIDPTSSRISTQLSPSFFGEKIALACKAYEKGVASNVIGTITAAVVH